MLRVKQRPSELRGRGKKKNLVLSFKPLEPARPEASPVFGFPGSKFNTFSLFWLSKCAGSVICNQKSSDLNSSGRYTCPVKSFGFFFFPLRGNVSYGNFSSKRE